MKGIVVYDSVNGNTKQVAEAMAERIKSDGHEAELVFLKDGGREGVTGDFLLIGSPTRGGKMTKGAEAFIGKLDAGYWKGRPVVVFDTIGPLSKEAEKRKEQLARADDGMKNAAMRMKEICASRGISVREAWHFAVVGFWGPLAPDALDMARDKVQRFVSGLK